MGCIKELWTEQLSAFWRPPGTNSASAAKPLSFLRDTLASRWLTDGTGTPRPQPQTFSKLVFLIEFSKSYICLDWLSGALVGVGGSDFIGH